MPAFFLQKKRINIYIFAYVCIEKNKNVTPETNENGYMLGWMVMDPDVEGTGREFKFL